MIEQLLGLMAAWLLFTFLIWAALSEPYRAEGAFKTAWGLLKEFHLYMMILLYKRQLDFELWLFTSNLNDKQ